MSFSIEPPTVDFPFNSINHDGNNGSNEGNGDADSFNGNHHLQHRQTTKGAGILFTRTIKLRNTSSVKARFSIHVLQELPGEFKILQQKTGAIFPGKFENLIVTFSPRVWSQSKGIFYVKDSSSDDMVPVHITAYPFISNLKIPKGLDFGKVILYQPMEKVLTIVNDIPVDFQFDFVLNQELPPNYYAISPMKGILRGLETQHITITFVPLTLCQAQLVFTFRTSQLKFLPQKCLVFGSGVLDLPKVLPLTEKKKLLPVLDSIKQKSNVGAGLNLPTIAAAASPEQPFVFLPDEKLLREEVFDPFTSQLESHIEMAKKTELYRVVSLGRDLPKDGNYTADSSKPSTARKSTFLSSSEFRIEVPYPLPIGEPSKHVVDKSASRLLLIFMKAANKVVYRIRADIRIKRLKDYKAGIRTPISQNDAAPLSLLDTIIQNHQQRLRDKKLIIPPARSQPLLRKFTAEIVIPPLTELFKPRPVPLIIPSYAEKMRFEKLPLPEPTLTFQLRRPAHMVEEEESSSQKSEPTGSVATAAERQPPYMPEIEVSSFNYINLYNAIPGAAHLYYPTAHIQEETSPQFLFNSRKQEGLGGYKTLLALEQELRDSSLEFSLSFTDLP